ncbi:MAG: pyruvate, phosphate dikinase, partial [Gemmatimonadetes bacterium]|nr:pyruvate, phosphate dikinase [Gemmatimonadota bacterium]
SSGSFPEGLWEQQVEAMQALEEAVDRGFGDPKRPLLVSCRSGAKFSMPGMMDTVLNLGLNDAVVEGIVELTGDRRFALDLYRRLLHMFGSVVLRIPDDAFESVIHRKRKEAGVTSDTELPAEVWEDVVARFKDRIRVHTGQDFPEDPWVQLRMATEAVFRSWDGKRARDYRDAAGIRHDLGTAVNVQTMVYGNIGENSATGVCMSRDGTTGERVLEGDFLENAQGEDVVAGTRSTSRISALSDRWPVLYNELEEIARSLEGHYRNMQDLEFTIDRGKLWVLQTRDGKRTAEAEVRIAVEMAEEGLITREEALRRVSPTQVDVFLHPRFDPAALEGHEPLCTGLDVSPGAAVGMAVFDADVAERWASEGRPVILVRPDTKPDDVHGMLAARGILTTRGGRTSHAALVARQFGKPAVVGVTELEIDLVMSEAHIGEVRIQEGDWLSIDGTRGEVYLGEMPTVVADLDNPFLNQLLGWADDLRRLGVRANADYPRDAERAREHGAEGIGLCRTEHMFFEADRLPIVQRMIMAKSPKEQEQAIAELLPLQRADFDGLFRAMHGLPVIIRLIDPPLHEFLPPHRDLLSEIADLKVRLQHVDSLAAIDTLLEELRGKQGILERVEQLHEENPMLGTRGVRLGILIPGLVRMQVRAIFEAACRCAAAGVDVHPEVMIPLVSHVNELRTMRGLLEAEAKDVMEETGTEVPYRFGTMIEIPRAALTAGEIAEVAEFFSFGTNDLTQTTFAISRDDAEQGFLVDYLRSGVLPSNPFATLDAEGVGRLMDMAAKAGRATRPDLEVGICGEHGGDPESVALCHRLGLDYVSCSPLRVPIARLAAAHAAMDESDA